MNPETSSVIYLQYLFDVMAIVVGFSFFNSLVILRTWILLDSQSSVDMFSNEKLLTNIHDARETWYCTVMLTRQLYSRKGTSRDTVLCGFTWKEL